MIQDIELNGMVKNSKGLEDKQVLLSIHCFVVNATLLVQEQDSCQNSKKKKMLV